MIRTKEDFAAWAAELKTGNRPPAYEGERLRCVAMPMGGIGAGQIAVCGDGSLRQWQIFNAVNHMAYVPHSFFALWVKPEGGKPSARVLASPALYDDKDFQPAPCISDHIVPIQQKKLLKTLPGVKETVFVGEYPFATLRYADRALPVDIEMMAYSPFVPLNVKDSSLPAIVFHFTVTNNGRAPVEVALASTLQNAVGYDGAGEIKGIEFPGYGGNRNQVVRKKDYTAIVMANVILPADAATNGSLCLAALEPDAEISTLPGWEHPKAFWGDFLSGGTLGGGDLAGPSTAGRTINGALAVKKTLNPGEKLVQRFVIAWHFPNRYINWGQVGFGVADEKSRFWLGNMYNNWFGSSLEVVEYLSREGVRLATETLEFRNAFYDSTLPYWFLEAVSGPASIIRSPTCFVAEDGRLYGFEGCCGASTGGVETRGGCCPLNCTHVWNYEMSLSRLFPELERSMRLTDLLDQQHPSGAVPHRTVLPLYLGRWGAENPSPDNPVYAADGHCGTVLKTYREWLQSGDREFLDSLWPRVKLAMEYAFAAWDSDADGVMDGPQWNTYDCFVYGHNSFITGMFLAALRAAEEMAKVQGEKSLAAEYRERYEKGRKNLDEETWGGEYYVQVYNARKHPQTQYGRGCHCDQLLGQWWAHILGLGYILPEEHVATSLESIYRYNFRWNFQGFNQKPRVFASKDNAGLVICTWPNGGRPRKRAILYADEVWTGMDYAVAGQMLYQGMVDEAFHIIKATRERYDGRERNPWNEVECGDHYARAMSSWSILDGAMGFHASVPEASLEFAPRVPGERFKSFFITGTGWGSYNREASSEGRREEISIVYGEISIKRLKFAGAAGSTPQNPPLPLLEKRGAKGGFEHAQISGAEFTLGEEDGSAVIEFERPILLKAGDKLAVTLGGIPSAEGGG